MNINERVEKVYQALGQKYSKEELDKISKAFIEIDRQALLSGEPVKLMDYGTLKPTTRKSRGGVQPGTTKRISIPESNYVRFILSKRLKAELNKE